MSLENEPEDPVQLYKDSLMHGAVIGFISYLAIYVAELAFLKVPLPIIEVTSLAFGSIAGYLQFKRDHRPK